MSYLQDPPPADMVCRGALEGLDERVLGPGCDAGLGRALIQRGCLGL